MSSQDDEDESFVRCIVRYPCILDKGKTPGVVDKKSKAMAQIQEEMSKLGKLTDSKKINKKLANIKARLKAKTDIMKTGNKKVVLRKWEEEMLKFMSYEENPVFSKIPGSGSKECGVQPSATAALQLGQDSPLRPSETLGASALVASSSSSSTLAQRTQPSRRKEESAETAALSNAELQRLVLLEQLRYFRMKNRRMLESQAWQHQLQHVSAESYQLHEDE